MMNEAVETIMIKDLITLGPESSIEHAKEIFKSNSIHHIPIIDEGKLIGIISTSDVWKNNYTPSQFANIQVKEIMSVKILKLDPDDKIGTAAELFLTNRFHAIPVVKDDFLLGLVTTFDILRYTFRKEYPNPILYKDILDKGLNTENK